MSIQDYVELKKKSKNFDRAKVASRIVEIARAIVKADEDNLHRSVVIRLAGRIAKQCEFCNFDSYWQEKKNIGKQVEYYVIANNYDKEHEDYKFWEMPKHD